MNKYAWCLLAVVASAVATQGYAQTATATATPSASTPTVTAAPTTAAANTATAKPPVQIPEDDNGKPVVAADNKEDFDAIAAAIRQQMQPGGRFSFATPDGRAKVNTDLNDMATIFGEFGSVDKMSPAALARVTYDQNAINEVLARYDANRRICHNETPVGSHIPKRVCKTLGEIQQENSNSQQALRRMHSMGTYNTMNGGHGGSGGH